MKDILTSLKAVSEQIRVRIVLLLMNQDACVCELMAVFEMAQSKLSHHLIALREAGLLQSEKRGKWNYYRVDTNSLNPTNRELLRSLSRWMGDDRISEKDRATLERVKEQMQICC
ncbi:MAG TPA: metalloregulator ArsR/SmtB family transcription factor [Bacteroidota bacterium]|nr:metalloregulator ArsR/SmtB family transcription factor [Bacteroidota bacterium]